MESTRERGAHALARAVQKEDRKVAVESWEAGGDGGGAIRRVYCPECGEHAPASEFYAQAPGAHAPARAVGQLPSLNTIIFFGSQMYVFVRVS